MTPHASGPDLPTSRRPSAGHEVDTLAGRAFKLIRAEIIAGRLAPNQRLRLEELRETYQVGFSPIREALIQLHSEGLVMLEKMKGFRVAPVSIDHLHDLTQVRIETEALGLTWSIERGDAGWEADVLGAFHRLSKQSKSSPGEAPRIEDHWRAEHRGFHSALVAACASPLLISIFDSLFDQGERYVALSIRFMEQPRDDLAEHEALMRAALDRDPAAARRLCREHTERTHDKVAASLELLQANLS
ncbi:MAG TPA: FCD domain-containing protein [Alphaproteobacteria bacterium]|nr:FCD domain-containing protein [Alphaproteobacteria bacterium]